MPSLDRDPTADARYAELLEQQLDVLDRWYDLGRAVLVAVAVAATLLGIDLSAGRAALGIGVGVAAAVVVAALLLATIWFLQRRRARLQERLSAFEGRKDDAVEALRLVVDRLERRLAEVHSTDEEARVELEARIEGLEAQLDAARSREVGRVVGASE